MNKGFHYILLLILFFLFTHSNAQNKIDYTLSVNEEVGQLDLWKRIASTGTITLGGNKATGFNASENTRMYVVIIGYTNFDNDPPAAPTGLAITQK